MASLKNELGAKKKALQKGEGELVQCSQRDKKYRQHERDLEKAVSQYQQQVASLTNELDAQKKALQKAEAELVQESGNIHTMTGRQAQEIAPTRIILSTFTN